jgi:hypothetical protein
MYRAAMTATNPESVHYLNKAEEYREKARATTSPDVRSALEAIAREYSRRAYVASVLPASAKFGL